MHQFGSDFARKGELNPSQLKKFAKPYRLLTSYKIIYRLLALFGITNYYWNYNLKKHNAFANRFDAPYSC